MSTPAMFSRPVTCNASGCREHAEYKIAAPWSVGRFSELKTYGISCAAHYAQVYKDAIRRRKIHPPSREELQGDMCVYRFEKGKATTKLDPVPVPE